MSRMIRLVILPGGSVVSATDADDVSDAQSAHGAGQPARRSGANFFRKFTGDGLDMEHEKGQADATDSSHQDNVHQEDEAWPQTCGEASNISSVPEAHTVPQPLGSEDLYTSLVYEIRQLRIRHHGRYGK